MLNKVGSGFEDHCKSCWNVEKPFAVTTPRILGKVVPLNLCGMINKTHREVSFQLEFDFTAASWIYFAVSSELIKTQQSDHSDLKMYRAEQDHIREHMNMLSIIPKREARPNLLLLKTSELSTKWLKVSSFCPKTNHWYHLCFLIFLFPSFANFQCVTQTGLSEHFGIKVLQGPIT